MMDSTISSNRVFPHPLPPGRTRKHRGVRFFTAYPVTIAATVAVRLNRLLLTALVVLTAGVSFAQSPEEEVSRLIAVLQDIGPKAKASTPTIISYLERELRQRPMDVDGCRHAVLTLRCIGPDASQALPLLRSILRQDERGHFQDIIEPTIEVVKGAAPVSELPGYLKRQ